MFDNSVYIVCPKYEAYRFKDISQQSFYKKSIMKWYDFYKSLGCEIRCFAEDMLAVALLHNKEVTWVTTIGASDKHFLETGIEDYPEEYKSIHKTVLSPKIIRASLKKYPVKVSEEYKNDSYAVAVAQFSALMNRIRYVANYVLDEHANTVVFISAAANMQYCNKPEERVGNGKSIITVRVAEDYETYSYGGINMGETEFLEIERCIYGKNV